MRKSLVNFEDLVNIIKDPDSDSSLCSSNVCFREFHIVLSNLLLFANELSEREVAYMTRSLQQYILRCNKSQCDIPVADGDIFDIDFGLSYSPEMGYNHPGLILGKIDTLFLVAPTTTQEKRIKMAFHPTDNPNGDWFYYKVGRKDGFAETCALIVGGVRLVSPARLLKKLGKLYEDISIENSLFKTVRRTAMNKIFEQELSAENADEKSPAKIG